ncbi:MAG: hypothetical protein ABI323_06625 [Solirubrobacteraceae bacterium]
MSRRLLARALLVGLLGMVMLTCAALRAPAAAADGDPASDVLASQPLFLPQDAGLSANQQAELEATLTAARRAGFRLRVAIIAGSADLGSVTELWRQPAAYARFLDQELSQIFSGPVLVVMPNGLGLAGPGSRRPAVAAALARPRATAGLGQSTLSAVREVLGAAGHPVSVAVSGVPQPAGSADVVALLVLVGGGLLIALSWAASLGTRPLGRRVDAARP